MGHFFKASSLVLGVSMGWATPPANAQETTAITTLWTSVGTGVAKQVAESGVGWALAAIGLAGGSAETNELASIEKDMETINDDLTGIKTELDKLEEDIEKLTCVTSETQTNLSNAVTTIDNFVDEYQSDFVQNAQMGETVIQTQVDSWVADVTDVGKDGVQLPSRQFTPQS